MLQASVLNNAVFSAQPLTLLCRIDVKCDSPGYVPVKSNTQPGTITSTDKRDHDPWTHSAPPTDAGSLRPNNDGHLWKTPPVMCCSLGDVRAWRNVRVRTISSQFQSPQACYHKTRAKLSQNCAVKCFIFAYIANLAPRNFQGRMAYIIVHAFHQRDGVVRSPTVSFLTERSRECECHYNQR